MGRTYRRKCTTCEGRHGKPTGRGCKRPKVSMAEIQNGVEKKQDKSQEEGDVSQGGTNSALQPDTSLTEGNVNPQLPLNDIPLPPTDPTPPIPPLSAEESARQDAAKQLPPTTPAVPTMETGFSSTDLVKLLLNQSAMMQQMMSIQTVTLQRQPAPPAAPDTHIQSLKDDLKDLTTCMRSLKDQVAELRTSNPNSRSGSREREEAATTNQNANDEEIRKRLEAMMGYSSLKPNPIQSYTAIDEDDRKKGKLLKSGHDLRAENEVVCTVPWPHMRIYRPGNVRGPDYDTLNSKSSYSHMNYRWTIQKTPTYASRCMPSSWS